MVEFDTIIRQFAEQGEKTGWSYIVIPADLAQQIKPDNKKSFRIKGQLDSLPIKGMAAIPMGEGNFIVALKADVRKALRKNAGAMLHVVIEEDKDFKLEIPADLQECFDYEAEAWEFFQTLPEGHRRYFVTWINSAKTSETRAKRIVNTVNAMIRHWGYNEMMRNMKANG